MHSHKWSSLSDKFRTWDDPEYTEVVCLNCDLSLLEHIQREQSQLVNIE